MKPLPASQKLKIKVSQLKSHPQFSLSVTVLMIFLASETKKSQSAQISKIFPLSSVRKVFSSFRHDFLYCRLFSFLMVYYIYDFMIVLPFLPYVNIFHILMLLLFELSNAFPFFIQFQCVFLSLHMCACVYVCVFKC